MTKYRTRIVYELQKIIESKIVRIHNVCDLICIQFDHYSIHSQTLVRFIKGNKIMFTRTDYFAKDNDNEELRNNFDVNCDKHKDLFIGNKVLSIKVNEIGDCFITLDNNSKIEIFIDSGTENFYDYNEQYRIFDHEGSKTHFVVYDNKKIDC